MLWKHFQHPTAKWHQKVFLQVVVHQDVVWKSLAEEADTITANMTNVEEQHPPVVTITQCRSHKQVHCIACWYLFLLLNCEIDVVPKVTHPVVLIPSCISKSIINTLIQNQRQTLHFISLLWLITHPLISESEFCDAQNMKLFLQYVFCVIWDIRGDTGYYCVTGNILVDFNEVNSFCGCDTRTSPWTIRFFLCAYLTVIFKSMLIIQCTEWNNKWFVNPL